MLPKRTLQPPRPPLVVIHVRRNATLVRGPKCAPPTGHQEPLFSLPDKTPSCCICFDFCGGRGRCRAAWAALGEIHPVVAVTRRKEAESMTLLFPDPAGPAESAAGEE